MIKVFDTQTEIIRDVEPDGIGKGFAIFSRSAVSVFKQYYDICGYFYLDRKIRTIKYIDMNDKILAIPEIFVCDINDTCKSQLENYNLTDVSNYKPSFDFFGIYMNEKSNALSFFGDLCIKILNNQILLNRFAIMHDSIIYPVTVQELYTFVQNVYRIIRFDYITNDYDMSIKYTIDALINGYHINFTEAEINNFADWICQLACEAEVDYNV